ncbi:MAG: DNA-3-methyladenine glycosylase [Saprospiraceae bacterium]|nr:DNA-3-methyladenine glycosylase [Saprospiraceae bacterium]
MSKLLLPRDYYLSQDVCYIAKNLIGKKLETHIDGHLTSGIIVETEAYRGPDDKASHSFNHRRTPRNESMYLEGGHSYIYICYGLHYLFNIVTAPKEIAHAVLIRALEPIDGIEVMMKRRKFHSLNNKLTKGPGALSVALGINKSLNAKRVYEEDSSIRILYSDFLLNSDDIACSKRIGVESAAEAAEYPWRFFIKNSKYVSAHKKIDSSN